MSTSLPPLALTYHGVADVRLRDDPEHLFVRPRDLEAHVGRLQDWGYELVTFGELARRLTEGRASGAAALTFDDGFADNAEVLPSLLARTEAPTTVFVVSGWLGCRHPAAARARIVTADETRALAEAGVEIGAHTVTHPDLATLPYAEALRELAESRDTLASVTGKPVEVAAYPYGHASSETRAACREAGFQAACRTEGRGTWGDPFDLPRQAMENRSTMLGLRLKRADRYEAIMRFRPARGARRLSRRVHELVGR